MDKRGQGEQFNWIFVIIAGAIILGFFMMFTFKYIQLQEKRQDVETVRFLGEGILGVSSKLQVGSGGAAIDSNDQESGIRLGTLVDLGFICNDKDATILINGGENAYYNLDDEIVFMDNKIKLKPEDGIDLWILPWNYPFHITNFIYLANSKAKFYVVYDTSSQEFVNDLDLSSIFDISVVTQNQLDDIKINNKVIFFTNQKPSENDIKKLKKNKEINFVYVNLQNNEVSFFDNDWSEPIKYYNLEQLYGAMFSNDKSNFECNVERALERVKVVAKGYSERARLLGQLDKREGCQYSQISNALSQYSDGKFELQEIIKQQNLAGAGCIWIF